MKTSLTYGALTALAIALLTLVLFFLGYHSDAAKMVSLGQIASLLVLAILVAGIILGTRARRGEIAETEDFTYGRALGTGFLIGVFAALFGGVFQLIYVTVINPGFGETLLQAQTIAWHAKGATSQQIEAAEKFTRMFASPVALFAVSVVSNVFFSFLIALLSAAFLRKKAGTAPLDSEPPTLVT